MDEIHLLTKDTLTQTLAQRIEPLRAEYKRGGAIARNAIFSDDYGTVHPGGTLHPRKPTAQEIAAAPIDQYSRTHLQAVPSATMERSSLTSPKWWSAAADRLSPSNSPSEVWARQACEWKCRYNQATILK
jgi:hypothetical protein